MFITKVKERLSEEKSLRCFIQQGSVQVFHNGNCKFEVLKNGVIRRIDNNNDDIFYLLFDVISKLRAEFISQQSDCL